MHENKLFSTKNLVLVPMFTAILAILSQISFMLPGGVPLTFQTFAIILCGTILGSKLSLVAIIVYLLLGMVGIPVFSNFQGGLHVLLGPTGGYLIGFIPMVFLTGLGKHKKYTYSFLCSFLGLVICHVIGLVGYYNATNTWILPSVPLMLTKDMITGTLAIMSGRQILHRLAPILRP